MNEKQVKKSNNLISYIMYPTKEPKEARLMFPNSGPSPTKYYQ